MDIYLPSTLRRLVSPALLSLGVSRVGWRSPLLLPLLLPSLARQLVLIFSNRIVVHTCSLSHTPGSGAAENYRCYRANYAVRGNWWDFERYAWGEGRSSRADRHLRCCCCGKQASSCRQVYRETNGVFLPKNALGDAAWGGVGCGTVSTKRGQSTSP